MNWFHNMSLCQKLTSLFMTIAVFMAAAVAIPMATYDMVQIRRAMADDLSTLGNVLAAKPLFSLRTLMALARCCRPSTPNRTSREPVRTSEMEQF